MKKQSVNRIAKGRYYLHFLEKHVSFKEFETVVALVTIITIMLHEVLCYKMISSFTSEMGYHSRFFQCK